MKQPLRIGLIMQGGRDWIGGTEYIKNLIFALGSLAHNVRSTFEICLICSQSIESSLYDQIYPHLDHLYTEEFDLQPLTLQNRIYWKLNKILLQQYNPRLDAFLRKANIDFVYPHITQSRIHTPTRSAAFIADFQHKYLPHFFTDREIVRRDQMFSFIASRASTVVLSSEAAKADFHKFFPEAAHKSKVLSFKTFPLSTWYDAEPLQIQSKYHLPQRFFLVSNQFWQHKDHLTIFKALELLHEKSINPIIVCTGSIYDNRQPNYSDTILQTIHSLGIAQQVYLLGLIPRNEQIQLMRSSLAVIQPSLFEGWSTVVEDARTLGKRMILSDFPVHLEQNPPGSVFFARNSPESLAPLLADWWEHLPFDLALEQEAEIRTNSMAQVEAFGYRFLEIVRGS